MSNEGAALLDRPGIFKARPFMWSVEPSGASKAIAISIGFLIKAQYDAGEWVSWEECDPYQIRGWFYVVGKNGDINTKAVEQLTKSLGWNGDLKAIRASEPPDIDVQITVKADQFEGKTRYKVGWINPGDFVPSPMGASDEDVAKLSVQFGSLLRAAAAAAKPKNEAKKATTPPAKKAPPKTDPPLSPEYQPGPADDPPF